jgi:hypothetical protein
VEVGLELETELLTIQRSFQFKACHLRSCDDPGTNSLTLSGRWREFGNCEGLRVSLSIFDSRDATRYISQASKAVPVTYQAAAPDFQEFRLRAFRAFRRGSGVCRERKRPPFDSPMMCQYKNITAKSWHRRGAERYGIVVQFQKKSYYTISTSQENALSARPRERQATGAAFSIPFNTGHRSG